MPPPLPAVSGDEHDKSRNEIQILQRTLHFADETIAKTKTEKDRLEVWTHQLRDRVYADGLKILKLEQEVNELRVQLGLAPLL